MSPHKPVVLSGVTYFPFQIRVHSNPSVRDFVDRNMIKSEIEHLCTYEGGGGINCDIVVGEQGETCCELFKFYDLIYCYDSIQFWKVQLSSQIPKIKDCLIKFKDIPSLGPHVIHFLKEFEGDSTSTLALVQYYELHVKDIKAEENGITSCCLRQKGQCPQSSLFINDGIMGLPSACSHAADRVTR